MEQEDPSIVAGALSDPLECFTNAWDIIKRCLTRLSLVSMFVLDALCASIGTVGTFRSSMLTVSQFLMA